jgi:predicted permease
MGVPPLLGRTPIAADAQSGAEPVTVLGYRFWQRQFGGDPAVIGRRLILNGISREVIGVMPPRFMWRGADVYLPVHFRRGEAVEGSRFVHVLGRVKPGVTEAQAEADLRPVVEHLKQIEPSEFPEQWRVELLSFKETFPSGIRSALWILFGATGLLLLISCANVSNLLLSRAAGRRMEMTVRSSLGASGFRLMRQLLTESILLGLAGGAIGIVLAYVLLGAMIRIVPPNTIPDEAQITMNLPVLLFSASASVLTALLFGLAPSWHGRALNLTDSLKLGARGSLAGTRGKLRSAFVVGEVALSLMLLSGAALMMRSLLELQSVDLGFPADRVLTMRVPLSDKRYPEPARRAAFFREVLSKMEAVPGVTAAGLNAGRHPFGAWGVRRVSVDGGQTDDRRVTLHQINRGYLRVFGIALAAGRELTEHEIAGAQRAALVNQAFVNRYMPDRNPIGAIVRIGDLQRPPASLADPAFRVEGVVRNITNGDPKEGVQPEIYIPYTITAVADTVAVRTAQPPAGVLQAVVAQVYSTDRDQPVTDIRTIEDLMVQWVLARPRFNLILFSVFGALGLILATVGVYGILSNAVSQRTPEIGLRMAMGATVSDVLLLVARQGLTLVGIGLVVGILASVGAGRLLAATMATLGVIDVTAFAAVAAVLLAAGCLACLWPAQRAARIDPSQALRNE